MRMKVRVNGDRRLTEKVILEVREAARRLGMEIANVEVRVYRDPDNMNKKLGGRERTPVDGTFSIGLGDFGAGWMTEEWLVQAYSYGFQTAQQKMKLPAKNAKTRLLITLAPGESIEPTDQSDYMQDYEKYK